MAGKNTAMKELDELKQYIVKCCYWYYVKAKPLIPDPEFDILFKKLQALEEVNGADPDSPTQMIYGDQESQYHLTENESIEGNTEDSPPLSNENWEYTFMYNHDQIWHNPIIDKEDTPIIWQKHPNILKRKKIRVFSEYQKKWVEREGGIPIEN